MVDSTDQLLSPQDVQRILGIGQPELWRRRQDGRFPLEFRRIRGGQHGMRKYILRSELDRFLADQAADQEKLLTLEDVRAITGWGRTTVYRKIKEGVLPAPCRTLRAGTGTRWSRDDVKQALKLINTEPGE